MPDLHPQLLAGLLQGLFVCLNGGLALSAIWGLWLLIAPDPARRFAKGADHWVPTASWFDRLDKPIDTTRWFYRYHRPAGTLIVAGASYGLWRWFKAYQREATIGLLDHRMIAAGLDWLVPAMEWIFLGFNCAILIFGLVVVFRPSLLKAPERFANRWVEVRADQVLDRHYDPLAGVLMDRPRLLGGVVVATCSFLLWRLIGQA